MTASTPSVAEARGRRSGRSPSTAAPRARARGPVRPGGPRRRRRARPDVGMQRRGDRGSAAIASASSGSRPYGGEEGGLGASGRATHPVDGAGGRTTTPARRRRRARAPQQLGEQTDDPRPASCRDPSGVARLVLDLDVHQPARRRRRGLGRARGQPAGRRPELGEGQLATGTDRRAGVVADHQLAVGGALHVELHPVGPSSRPPGQRRQTVFSGAQPAGPRWASTSITLTMPPRGAAGRERPRRNSLVSPLRRPPGVNSLVLQLPEGTARGRASTTGGSTRWH